MERFAFGARGIGAWLHVFVATLTLLGNPAAAQQPQSPEAFFGHPMGEDYKLIPWPRIVDYFRELAANTDRMHLRDLGTTTEGKPFLFAEISSADTIADLQPHKIAQWKIADPRLIQNEDDERRLIYETKVPVLVNCQLHATEVAASQMSMELAYDLVTGDTPEIREILERVIVLLIPAANPDGQQMVAEWYTGSIGTPWEGVGGMPWIYQKYAGHDNNRDWFMLNLKETRLTTEVLYREWFPTIVWDVHQMGNNGARLFVPPFHDPKNTNVHPIIDQTLLIIGGHMAGDLARQGMKGVVHGAIYDNWWAGGFRTTPYRHNMVGILTEAASVNGASPVFQRKSELRGETRGMPAYDVMTNFPDPWPGGWWRLRDIVEYEKSIAMSLFTLAARYHDMFQRNYIHFGREAIALGQSQPPFAWIVPPGQRDPGTAHSMLERLHATSVEVHRANAPFTADGVTYPEGTFILYTAQPYRPHLMDMMERQVYPDRVLYPDGPAEPPYDMAGWTLPLQMGVRHAAVSARFEADAVKLDAIPLPQGAIENAAAPAFFVPAGRNDDFRFANRLHDAEVPFRVYSGGGNFWSDRNDPVVPLGSIVVANTTDTREKIKTAHEGLSVELQALRVSPAENAIGLKPMREPRLGLYQPWTASMDEGWTRLVLDNFEFDYVSLHNAEIRAGDLADRYDCIVLPSIPTRQIVQGRAADTSAPEFTGGIGEEGIVALQDFVLAGGTLVAIDESCNLPIDRFNVPVKNIVRDLKTEEFYCPGSVLRLRIDPNDELGWGMPEWYSGYFAGSQAFEIVPEQNGAAAEKERQPANRFPSTAVSRYSDTVLLESGWIRGGNLITDKPAIVRTTYGSGSIVLIGFGVQRRGQPHGTFRILFNAIQSSTL